ncbi:MAG: hypothetical protein Fur0046_21850 [Cyanobacteria bacterium J069]|nr:MAG: DUF1817 domain-containing protein [Cyanobacteria bacterium J069]
MTTVLTVTADQLARLDLAPATAAIAPWLAPQPSTASQPDLQLQFQIDFPREADDPRELSEIPEVRLWFVRLDACYPWLPLLLDWEAGELGRYAAMLVPHEFSRTEGIRFNPEALELFVMSKIFAVADWMRQHGGISPTRLKFMTQMLGYELDDGFFELL